MSVRTSQFSRFRDGKIVEMHAVLDSYDMVEQTLGRPFDLAPDWRLTRRPRPGRTRPATLKFAAFDPPLLPHAGPGGLNYSARQGVLALMRNAEPAGIKPRTDQPDRRDRHSGAARPAALGPLPHPRRRGARRHLDPRRARGDARRHGRGRAQGKPGLAVQQCRCRPCRQRVSRRRGARGDLLRLADRPARAQEAVLHHAHRLPAGDGGDRVLVEFVELPPLPLHHRGGHRRRIRGDQFDHPGVGPGARARLDRPRDQRLVLDRRGARRTRRRSCCSTAP